MAEKTVAQAIAQAYGSTKEEILKLYNKLGDMGKAVEEIGLGFLPTGKDKLNVEDVFKTLLEIANTSGEGTVEKRQNLLADLLRRADSISAKY